MGNEINIYMHSLILSIFSIILFFSGYLLRWFFAGKKLRYAEQKAKDLLNSAEKEVSLKRKNLEVQNKDLLIKLRKDFERENKDRQETVVSAGKRIIQT